MVHEHPIELARLDGASVEEIVKHAHEEGVHGHASGGSA